MPLTKSPRVNLAHWPRLSPLLDELLDLDDPAERAARLALLRENDPLAADNLQALLDRLDPLQAQGFLQQPALARPVAPPPAPPAAQPGQRLGAYELQRLLGEGGMGQVWLARRADGQYDEAVAVKLMRSGLLGAEAVARFRREAQILALLDHPGIVRLRDAGVSDAGGGGSQPYLVLDLVQGQRIDLYCEGAALTVRQRVQLMADVLDAVSHAHQRGVLHRDLKPANILVTGQGRVRLLDFGIAKLTGEAEPSGLQATAITRHLGPYTERYAAPEQMQGQEVTTASDVYAAGVLLYELLTGRHPTQHDPQAAPLQRLQALVEQLPPLLHQAAAGSAEATVRKRSRELRGDLSTIVAQALKKQPGERYAQAGAFADDLRRWLAHDPISAVRDSTGYRLGRYLRRHRVPVLAATGAGVLALAAGAGLAVWQATQARAERVRAEALVADLLGGLKAKLQPLGRLDLMADGSRQALDYYRGADPGGLDATALKRRADALNLIGEMARLTHDSALARSSLEQAVETSRRALQAEPASAQRHFDLAEILMRLASAHDLRGSPSSSLAAAREGVAQAEQASLMQPGDLKVRLGLLSMRQFEAYALNQLGQPTEALARIDDIERALRELPADQPETRRALADLLQLRGLAALLSGRLSEAVEAFESCGQLLAQWQAQAGELQANVWEKRRRASVLRELARARLEQGQVQAALAAARLSAASFTPAEHGAAGEVILREEMVRDRAMLARAEWAVGTSQSRAAALAALAEADAIAAALPAIHVERALWHVRIRGEWLAARAAITPSAGDEAGLQAYIDGLSRFEGGDRRLSAPSQLVVAQVQAQLAQRLQARGQIDAARTHWERMLERLQPLQGLPTGGPPMAVALRQQARAALRTLQPTS